MDLRQIIRENVEDFILDSIISEEIINEANRFKRFSNNSNKHSIKNKKRNLSQIKKDNETRRQEEKKKKEKDNNFGAKLADDGKNSIGSGSDSRGKEIPVEEPKTGENPQVNGGDNNVIPFIYDETPTNGDDNNGGNNYTTPTIDDETPNNGGDNNYNSGNGDNNNNGGNADNNNGGNGTAPNDQQQQQQAAAYFKPFADRLRQLIGTGFDATPVQNNQAAVQHINNLNPFVYYVINAIESGNINSTASPAAGGSGSGGKRVIDPYGKDKTDIALGAINGAVGYTADKLNYLGQGQNNPFNNVFKAFGDAHNKTMNDVNGYLNQKKYNDAYGRNTQNVNSNGGGASLTDLMQNMYPHLLEEYNKINTSYNGIFGSVPNVSNCHEVLQDLSSKVAEYNKQQQQNPVNINGNTEQPTGADDNVPNNTTEQSKEKQMLEGFANRLKEIDGNGERLELEAEYAQKHNLYEVSYFIEDVGKVSEKCIAAIESGKIRMSDEADQENIIPLTIIMGLSDYFTKNENVISFYDSLYRYHYEKEIDKKLPKDTVAYNLFMTLYNLRKQMEAKGIMDEY